MGFVKRAVCGLLLPPDGQSKAICLLLIGSVYINPLAIWSICCKNAYRWFSAKVVIVKPVAG
jgi:hypothetical protein